MAVVYLAEQQSLRRKVALKVLRGSLANDPTYVARFEKEARAAAALVHGSIVQIYEVGNIDGVRFIAQEYVAGQSLGELVKRQGPLKATQAVSVMRQVGAALHKAAEIGVVHRDIKPDNLMVANSGEVKVADFGLASIIDDVQLTQEGVTMGTPLYMSPEQVEGKKLDARSDLYSLGVTCHHLLTGHPPFEGETALAVAMQHLRSEATRLETIRPDLPDGLCRIIHRLMAKKAEDRYKSAAAMLRELRSLGLEENGLEGNDEPWPSAIDEWSSAELAAAAAGRKDATQQLATVMVQSQQRSPVPWWIVLASLSLGACLIGAAVGWMTRSPSLLAYDPSALPKIEKQNTAREQYYFATLTGTEAALESVRKHYPEDEYYIRRANQRLAELYLANEEFDRAAETFELFSTMPPEEKQFRAYGLVGEALVLESRGEKDEMAAKLGELLKTDPSTNKPLHESLDDAMRNEFKRMAKQHSNLDIDG